MAHTHTHVLHYRYDYARAAVTTGAAVSPALQPGTQPPAVPPSGPPVAHTAPPPSAAMPPPAEPRLEPPSLASGSSNEDLCSRLTIVLQRVDESKMHKKAKEDMDTRIQMLFAALRENRISGVARERTSELILALSDGQYGDAREIVKALVTHHSFDVEGWIVGIKRLLHELDPAGAHAPQPTAVVPPPVPMMPPLQPGIQPPAAGVGLGGDAGSAISMDGYTNYDTYVPPSQQILQRKDDESTLDSWHNWASSFLAPPSAKDTLASIGK